jgi:hypothetical protein
MLNKFHNRLSNAKDWYHTLKKELLLATNVSILNKSLYQELEEACIKRHGVLTFAEYLTIDQFGKNGYYAHSKTHGKTDVDTRWADAIAAYCQKYGHDTIIEFGCGTGDLAVKTVSAFRKQSDKEVFWIGVEIDGRIHDRIRANFAKHNRQLLPGQIVTTIDEISVLSYPLIIFPYSLDNIPPQVFVNTKSAVSYPDAILGITVQNGAVSEVVIPQEIMQKKGITVVNGVFTQKNYSCDLSSWKLLRGQRAYIAPDIFTTLYQCVKKFNDITLLIIDEFRNEPLPFSLGNLGIPRSLHEDNAPYNNRSRYLRESGRHNFYYPLYKGSVVKFLSSIGFRSIEYEIEQKKAAGLTHKTWYPTAVNYWTFALIAKNPVAKTLSVLPITYNAKTLL